MAEYIYMQNYTRNGKMGISYRVIEHVASDVCREMADTVRISENEKDHPIRCSITKGRAYLSLEVKIKEGANAAAVASKLQEEIAVGLINSIELSDCTINVNVNGIF